jgi:hypothetical protein
MGTQADKETDLYRITNAKVIGLLAAIVVLGGSWFINIFVIGDHTKTSKLEDKIEEIRFKLAQIERDDMECERRTDRQEIQINEINNWRISHKDWGMKMRNEDESRLSRIEEKLDDHERQLFGNYNYR